MWRDGHVVLALLAMEIAFSIASTAAGLALARRRIAALFRTKALPVLGPGLDQRAIHREVLAGKQLAYLRKVQHLGEELGRDIAREQPIRFLQNTVASHTGSSADSPTNQRNSRL